MPTLLLCPIALLMVFHLQTAVGTYCNEDIFLRAGHRGVISCDFGEFDVVGWLNPTQDLETTAPFIYLEGSEIRGPESGSGEYSMLLNGSLIIEDVNLNHEKNFTVRIVENGDVFHHEVPVKVYVLPVPEYPVVNGRTDQERVVVHSSNGKASFDCTMDNIRPAVPLEVVFISPISDSITMTTSPSTLNNPDGTYNVSLEIRDIILPYGVYFLQCRAAHSLSYLPPLVADVILVVHDEQHNFPLVNGLDNQQHIVLNVKREGTLTCSMDRVSPNAELEWNYINHDSSTRVALERQRHYSFDNGDGSYNITSITNYKTTSYIIQCVSLKCVVSGKAARLYPLYTAVELNFPTAGGQHMFPFVNELDNQQHIVLDVNREGTLTCFMDRVSPNGYLEWNYINHDSSTRVALERQRNYIIDNGDDTYNITSVTNYKATSVSIRSVTLKCVVSGKAAHMYPLYTTVELHFPAADSDSSSNTSQCNQPLVLSVAFLSVVVCVFNITTVCLIYKIIQIIQIRKNNTKEQKAPHEEEESMHRLTPGVVADLGI